MGKVTELYKKIVIPPTGINQSRENLPQIRGNDFEEFLDFLKIQGISYNWAHIKPKELKATQQDSDPKKVEKTESDDKFFISLDNYVLDGHHRWLSLLNDKPEEYIKPLRIHLNVLDALRIMKEFELSNKPKNITEIIRKVAKRNFI